jgi:hypothetical protein
MTEGLKGSPLSFTALEELLFEGSQSQDFIGPPEPIADPRICAGLLFERWNDGSERNVNFRCGDWPVITIRTDRDFGPSSFKFFVARREAIQMLLDAGILRGTPHMGYTDMEALRLSKHGMKIVVTEWFTEGQAFTDIFCAGASIDAATGEASWS